MSERRSHPSPQISRARWTTWRGLVAAGLVIVTSALTGCGKDSQAPSEQSEPLVVRGGDRLAWDQQAISGQQVQALSFRLYVDGRSAALASVTCSSQAGASGYPCSGGLPTMTPGVHTLELSTILDGQESAHSSQLVVRMTATAAAFSSDTSTAPSLFASMACVSQSPHDCYHARVVARNVDSATTLTAARDGSILFVEGERRVRVIVDDQLLPEPALVVPEEARIVGLAIDEHDEGSFVYVSWAETLDTSTTVNVTRYRELQHTLGEGARIVTGLPFTATAFAPLAVGVDGFLYLALPSTMAGSRADDASRDAGVVLRLTRDGLTPTSNVSSSTHFARGSAWPTTLATDLSDGLWTGGRARAWSQEIARIGLPSAVVSQLPLNLAGSGAESVATASTTRLSDAHTPDPVVARGGSGGMFVVTDGRLLHNATFMEPLEELTFDADLRAISVVDSPLGVTYVSVTTTDRRTTAILSLVHPRSESIEAVADPN